MDPITLTIAGIVLVVSAVTALFIDKYKKVRSKNAELEALRQSLAQYTSTYSFEDCDSNMILNCQNKLRRLFRNGNFVDLVNRCTTIEEKERYAKTVAEEIAKSLGLERNDGCLDIEILFDDLGFGTNGATWNEGEHLKVALNRGLLLADPQQLIKTMCHEFRHCVQFRSTYENVWGYSPQRVAQWLFSWTEYVQCSSLESYDAYVNQIIEKDANKFADEVCSILN